MKRALLSLVLLLSLTMVARAVMVTWTLPASDERTSWWKTETTADGATTVGIRSDILLKFVYVQTSDANAPSVGTDYANIASTAGNTPVNKGTAITGATVGDAGTTIGSGLNVNWYSTTGAGWYYIVAFDTSHKDAATTPYTVAGSYWDGNYGDSAKASGFSNAASAGTEPDLGDFIEVPWLGGTWHAAAPEPTVAALLALGIAGLALRRKTL